MSVDCLSALDECFLRLETEAAHMHVGWTLLVQGRPPTLEQLRAHIDSRLQLLPRFRRRVLTSSLHLHDPVWADDPRFDLARHVTAIDLSEPGARALRSLAGELLSKPLERSRPLWRLHLVRGVGNGRFAVVGQAHHALVDGLAAIEMAKLLLDSEPRPAVASLPVRFEPTLPPGVLQRATAAAAARARLVRSAGAGAVRTLGNPAATAELLLELRRVGAALAAAGLPAPRTRLNRPIGPARVVAFAQLPLHVAKELSRRREASVNDVVLATASLALGRYLRRSGESHPWLRALVPVSTRSAGDDKLGNNLSAILVELPVGERDPVAALGEVSRQTRERKRAAHAAAIDALLRAGRLVPLQLRDAFAWLVTRPQTFNAVVSNIPGPDTPLYLLGRRVLAAYPAVPLMPDHGVSIGVLSYCGSLYVGVYADPGIVPDASALARDIARAFEALRAAVDPRPEQPLRPRRLRPRHPAPV